jgi:hypothetical protein
MATEHFTVIALPHSVAADAGSSDNGFHVSLFVAPELTPDRGEAELRTFTHFPHWAAVVRGDAEITLRDQVGEIEATAKLDVVDPDVWDAVFPPDTPVRAPGARTGPTGTGGPSPPPSSTSGPSCSMPWRCFPARSRRRRPASIRWGG